MSIPFLTNIDLNGNQILNALLHPIAGDPNSPANGQVWYNSTTHELKLRKNGANVIIASNVSATAPITYTGGVIAINAATTSNAGSMSAADKTKLDGATDAATASALVQRDANARFKAADPAAASDVATMGWVQSQVAGLNWKDSARVATTANITLSGTQTIDGVAVIAGDRVFVKNQTAPAENGIYVVAAGAWSRATDADTASEILQATAFIEEGTTNADTVWIVSTNAPITLGTTSLTVVQFGGGATYSPGAGLTASGNTFNVGGNAGRIVVNADDVDLASGIATPGTYRSVTVDTYGRVTGGSNPYAAAKFTANFGNGAATSFTVNHALGTQDVTVLVYRNSSPFDQVFCDVELTDANNVTLRFAVAPTTNQFRVVIIG
jgi:hypothetical protein